MYNQIDSNKRRSAFFIFIFVLFVIGIGYVFSKALGQAWIFPVAIVISIIQSWASYYYSDKIALAISGAREITRGENVELHRIVENLSITSGMPTPKIYIIEDTAPNAFATGRDPKHASIAVTSGILQKLEKPELEGVIAHEMSHIQNYDIRLMTIVVVLVGVIALASDLFLRWSWLGGRRRDNDNSGNIGAAFLIAGILLALLSPLIATMIQLAISRKREFLADASGALLTRYPEGLARALEKISADAEPLEVANKATAHLYITNPMKAHSGRDSVGWFSGLFNTHPPIEERIQKLRGMIGSN